MMHGAAVISGSRNDVHALIKREYPHAHVCMVFVDDVYNNKVFYVMASDCICSIEKVRHGFVENHLH